MSSTEARAHPEIPKIGYARNGANQLRPSSSDRAVAALTASTNAAWTPCPREPPGPRRSCRQERSPAPGAPLGSDRTRRACAPRRESSGSKAPTRLAGSKPACTPASISASATMNTYAGPDPERPVTASSDVSSWRTTSPTVASRASAHATSFGRCVRARGDRCRTSPEQRRRVGHGADDCRALGKQRLETPDRGAGENRKDAPHPSTAQHLAGRFDVGGLYREHRRVARQRPSR